MNQYCVWLRARMISTKQNAHKRIKKPNQKKYLLPARSRHQNYFGGCTRFALVPPIVHARYCVAKLQNFWFARNIASKSKVRNIGCAQCENSCACARSLLSWGIRSRMRTQRLLWQRPGESKCGSCACARRISS